MNLKESIKCVRVIAVSYGVAKRRKGEGKKKNTKQIRQTLETHISGMAMQIQLEFGI